MTDDPPKDDSLLLDWLDRRNGRTASLSGAVETLSALFSDQIDSLRAALESRIDDGQQAREARLDHLEQLLRDNQNRQQERFDHLETQLGSLEETVDALQTRISELKENQTGLGEEPDHQSDEPPPRGSDGGVVVIHDSIEAQYVLRLRIDGVACRMQLTLENGRCTVRLSEKNRGRYTFERASIREEKVEFSARLTPTARRYTYDFSIRNGANAIVVSREDGKSTSVPYELLDSSFA